MKRLFMDGDCLARRLRKKKKAPTASSASNATPIPTPTPIFAAWLSPESEEAAGASEVAAALAAEADDVVLEAVVVAATTAGVVLEAAEEVVGVSVVKLVELIVLDSVVVEGISDEDSGVEVGASVVVASGTGSEVVVGVGAAPAGTAAVAHRAFAAPKTISPYPGGHFSFEQLKI